jgi:hypothetical protein
MPCPTLSELSTLALAVKVNVWPVAFTRAVTWPVPTSIPVILQQATVAAVATGFVAAGADAGAATVVAGAAAVGVAAAAPLVIEQQADAPLIETCLLVKLA